MEESFEADIFKRESFDEVSTSLNDTNQMRTPSALSIDQSPYLAARTRLEPGDLTGFITDIRQERASAARLEARLTRMQQKLCGTHTSDQPTARSVFRTERSSLAAEKPSSYSQLNQHFRNLYRTPSARLKPQQETDRVPPHRPLRPNSFSGVDLSLVSKGDVPWLQTPADAPMLSARNPSVPRLHPAPARPLSYHRANSVWNPRPESITDLTSTLLKQGNSRSGSVLPRNRRDDGEIMKEIEDFQKSVAYLRHAVLGQAPNPSLLRKPPSRAELESRYLKLVSQVGEKVKELEELRFQNILFMNQSRESGRS